MQRIFIRLAFLSALALSLTACNKEGEQLENSHCGQADGIYLADGPSETYHLILESSSVTQEEEEREWALFCGVGNLDGFCAANLIFTYSGEGGTETYELRATSTGVNYWNVYYQEVGGTYWHGGFRVEGDQLVGALHYGDNRSFEIEARPQ